MQDTSMVLISNKARLGSPVGIRLFSIEPIICNPPLYIALTFEPIFIFKNAFEFRIF